MKLFILLLALAGTCFAFRGSSHHQLSSKSEHETAQSCPPSPDLKKGFTALSVTTVQTDAQVKSLFKFGWSYVIQRIITQGDAPDDTYTLDKVTSVGVQTITTWTYYRFTVVLVNTKSWRITITYIIYFNTKTGEISVTLPESGNWVTSKDPIAPAIVTQAGTPDPILGNAFATGSRDERSFISHVNFPQAFSEVPSVGLNLVGFDNQVGQWNFEIFPQNITTTGFDINVTLHAPSNNVYSFQPSYLATISKYSGIYFAQSSISTADADVAAISTGTGERTITRQLNVDLTGKKALAFLRGMGFVPGTSDPTVSVALSGNSVVYKTWNNTQFYRASSTIVYWDKSKKDVFTLDAGTSSDEPLYLGFGPRTLTVPFNSTGGLQSPQTWAGIWKLWYNGYYNDRLKINLDPAYINITTWYDSHPHDIQDHLFMTCQDGNAACLSK